MSLQHLLLSLNQWAYRGDTFVRKWRAARMAAMVRLVKPPGGARIIDLGGTEYNWRLFDHDFHVTLVNLPGTGSPVSDSSRFYRVEGSACDLEGIFNNQSFDVCFSNSTIEHVGDEDCQAKFAREAVRLAPAYWIQTPSDRCPVEVHTGLPLYWQLPGFVKSRLHLKWRRKLPAWYAMIEQTRVLSRRRMLELFPSANIYVERRLGLEKSYAAYRPLG